MAVVQGAPWRGGDGQDSVSGDDGRGIVGRTKNKELRMAPLAPALRIDLEAWAATCDGPMLFPGRCARYQCNRELREMLDRARIAAAITDLTFRMCRTTFATLFEGHLADVQEILGHHTAAFTPEKYKRAVPLRQQAAVEELETRLMARGKERVNCDRFCPELAKVCCSQRG